MPRSLLAATTAAAAVLLLAACTGSNDSPTANPTPVTIDDPAKATHIVLEARADSDLALLDSAAAYLATRIDAEVTVAESGDALDVRFSGPAGEEAVSLLLEPSDIHLRPVLAMEQVGATSTPDPGSVGTGTSSPTWSGDTAYFLPPESMTAYLATDCTQPLEERAPADSYAVACSADGELRYLLGAESITDTEVASLERSGVTVTTSLGKRSAVEMNELSSHLSELSFPQDQMAILDGPNLLAAPSMMQVLVDAEFSVSFANHAEDEALVFAGALGYQSPLLQLSIAQAYIG